MRPNKIYKIMKIILEYTYNTKWKYGVIFSQRPRSLMAKQLAYTQQTPS